MRALIVVAGVLVIGSVAFADPRPFTFTYDTYPEGKGHWEYEQWVTWSHSNRGDVNNFAMRHEIEFGLADKFDLSVYAADWHIEEGGGQTVTHFDGVGIEAIYYLTNPAVDPVGLGLYAEARFGPDEIAFEGKLLVQKDIGNWIFAYNFVLETEIERGDGDDEMTGILGQVFGASYALNKNWLIGAEAQAEWEFEDWSKHVETTVYAGPVISFQKGHWWVTVTPAIELTGEEDAADWKVRMIAGIQF